MIRIINAASDPISLFFFFFKITVHATLKPSDPNEEDKWIFVVCFLLLSPFSSFSGKTQTDVSRLSQGRSNALSEKATEKEDSYSSDDQAIASKNAISHSIIPG